MSLVTPLVTYNYIKINGVDVALSATGRVSFTAPYNKIDIKFTTPTNCSLRAFEVRITEEENLFDVGVGELAYWDTNLPANTQYSFSIPVNATLFKHGNKLYRVSLYAKSAIDGSWDVTYLFFTTNNELFTPSGSSGLEVLTTRDAPIYPNNN